MIGIDGPIKTKDLEWLVEFPQIELGYLNKLIQTKLTTMVADRELLLVIEKRSTEDKSDLGFATYSNSDATVLSYMSILRTYGYNQTNVWPMFL